MSVPKLDRDRAALVVIDVQEGFRDAVDGFDGIARATATMIRGAAALDLPVVITEQYPKGLGPTVPEVADSLPAGIEPIAKTVFSAAAAEGFELGGREQAIVCGIESHVCVNQTVLDLLDAGMQVHVVADAVGSRSAANRALGLEKAERAGAWTTSVEMALFELLGAAGSDEFKSVQKLVLEYAP
jgi:nicotinamidase-related amidase